jgi:hypothetical protein
MIFEVTPDHIFSLSDEDLRILVGRLCEAETRSKGFAPAGITYGGNQNAPDGGIDVRADVPAEAAGGFIPRTVTAFQVKAEDMPRSAILGEMCPDDHLRPSITAIGERHGAYVIVSSKGSVADAPLQDRLAAMRQAVADEPRAMGLHLDFYDRQRVATWVNGHPPEVAWVRHRVGRPLTGWQPFADWSSAPDDLEKPYLLDQAVRLVAPQSPGTPAMSAEEGIGMLRSLLRKPGGVVRLVGLSGLGKTRLIQALFDPRVGADALDQTTAIYADVAEGPTPAPLDILPRLKAAGRFHVLVLDNCGFELHRRIAQRLKGDAVPISLLTVEYDLREDEPEGTDVIRLEPASAEIVQKILERKYPRLTDVERSTVAAFSEGNARIALALAATAREEGSLANLGDRALFERLFRQQQADDPRLLQAAKVLALVYSFDGETIDRPDADLPILASLAGMAPEELHGHVAELLRRQLVQRRSRWRALLPHALAHRLAKNALQDIPPATLVSRLVNRADERLLKSFSRRIGCLHDSGEARGMVAAWLSDGGYLGAVAELNDFGITILENVAPVDPGGILRAIGRAAATDLAALATPDERARRIVGLLRSIAYDAQHFDEAVRLIARIAAGRERSNDVAAPANVFVSMFHLYLSGTHALPRQRADLLRWLLASGIAGADDLVLAGLDAMLECGHFSSALSFEFGSRKRDYGLQPSGEDVRAWFRAALDLAGELDERPPLRQAVRRAVERRFTSLALRTGAIEEVLALARGFAADGDWIDGWGRAQAAEREARKAQREPEAALLADLAASLRPASLKDRVTAYALGDDFCLLHADEAADTDDSVDLTRARLEAIRLDLGRELALDLDTLFHLLPQLMASNGPGVVTLGREIGSSVEDPRFVWEAIVRQIIAEGATASFGGFSSHVLRGIAERAPALATAFLDDALTRPELHALFVHMQASVGLDDRGLERLTAAAPLPSVPVASFGILAWGGLSVPLDGARLRDLLLALEDREGGIAPAIEVLRMRLYGLKQNGLPVTPEDRDVGVHLVGRVGFELCKSRPHVVEAIIADCFLPGRHDDAALSLCLRLRDAFLHGHVPPWDIGQVSAALGRGFPQIVLDVFVDGSLADADELNGSTIERRAARVGVLDQVDEAAMIEWAREHPDQPPSGGPGGILVGDDGRACS